MSSAHGAPMRRWLRRLTGRVAVAACLGATPALALANADLVLNHTVDKASANATDLVTYTLRVTNNGPQAASGIVLSDTLPATTAYVSHTATAGTCVHSGESAGGILSCNIGGLANSEEAVVTLVARITASSPTTIVNSATVTASSPDPDTANNTLQRNVTVSSGTDLRINQTGSAASVTSGGTLTYTLSVDNLGPDTATSLSVTLTLAPGFVRSGGLPGGCTQSGQVVTCTHSSLSAGGSWSIGDIAGEISVAGPSTLSTSASATSAVFDGVSANNTALVDTSVDAGTDVSVAVSRSPTGTLVQLDEFEIRLTPRYTGGLPQDLTLTANIDPAFQILGFANTNGWNCGFAGQAVTCTRADGGGADGAFDHAIGRVDVDVRAAGSGSNLPVTASIAADSPADADVTNNDASLNVTVQVPSFDLQALKSGPTRTLRVVNGETFEFDLRVRNNSNVGFVGELTMTDTLPAGLDVGSYTANGWNCSPAALVSGPASIVCTRTYTAASPLAAGATTPSVLMTAVATATGSLTNSMCVTNTPESGFSYPADGNAGNDCASSGVEGQLNGSSADIQVNKSATAGSVVAGSLLTYTLEIVNAGPSAAQNVTLSDSFANLFTGGPGNGFEGASVAAGTATLQGCSNDAAANGSSRNLSCTFSQIPVCTPGSDCPVVTVQLRPLGDTSAGVNLTRGNTAGAYSSVTADPVYGNNEDSVDVTVTPLADISATKTAAWAENPDPIAAGTALTYTITIHNATTGASGASNVTMTDTLPLDLTFVSATASNGGTCGTTPGAGATTTAGNRTVSCAWTTLGRNQSRVATIIVRPNHGTQGTTLANTVTSATATPEVTLDNNDGSANVDVAVARVDLATTQVDSPDPLQIGDTVVYTLTVTNFGPSVATDVLLYDVLPTAGLSFQGFEYVDGGGNVQSGLPPGVSCPIQPSVGAFGKTTGRVDTGLLTPSAPGWLNGAWDAELGNADLVCDVSSLMLSGSSVSFRVLLKAEASGVYTNYVIARSREHRDGIADVNPPNDTEPENTTVRTRVDLEVVSKTASPATVSLFEPFTYAIAVRNNGPHEAFGVVLADTLPAGMELTGTPTLVVDQGSLQTPSCTGAAGEGAFTCTSAEASADAAATVTVPVRLTSWTGATVTNTAALSITGNSFDQVPGNNSNSGPVAVVKSSIAGRVYHDQNLDGGYDAGEAPIATVTVALSGTDAYGNAVDRSTQTVADGSYLFDDLAPGTYTLGETQPASWLDGQETVGSAGGSVTANDVIDAIVLAANTAATGYDFGEYLTATGAQVSGTVYHDRDNDGTIDAGEEGIAGVTVTLSGTVDASFGGGAVNLQTTTDADGHYSFAGLLPGGYALAEQQPASWLDGIDSAGSVGGGAAAGNDAFSGLVLTGGMHAADYDFGELQPASIAGVAYIDPNQNAVLDGGETLRIDAVTVTLSGTDDLTAAVNRSLVTDANGAYLFSGLRPGSYTVTETRPAWLSATGAQPGVPVAGTAGGDATTQSVSGITVASADALVDYNFGHLGARIEGVVYRDTDGNGLYADGTDEPLPSVLVRITDASGTVHSLLTGADGRFARIVPPGEASVLVEEGTLHTLAAASLTIDDHGEGNNPTVVTVPLGGIGVDNTGYVGTPVMRDLLVVKTAYEGHDGGAGCPGVKELVIVDASRAPKPITWCFTVTNNGASTLALPAFDDPLLGIVAGGNQAGMTLRADSALPLAPGESATWYFEETRDSSLVNEVTLTMTPVDGGGNPAGTPVEDSDQGAVFAYVFDPPFGIKTGQLLDARNRVRWTMVWINDSPIVARNVEITDPLAADMSYVADSLVCQPAGTTTVASCVFEAPSATYPQGRIVVVADIGPDLGATDAATASNELVISFDVAVPPAATPVSYQNTGTATWTPPGETEPLTRDTDAPVDGGGPTTVTVLPPSATAIPALSPMGIALLAVVLASLTAWTGRRRHAR